MFGQSKFQRFSSKDFKDNLEDYESNTSNFVKENASAPFDPHNTAKGWKHIKGATLFNKKGDL